MFVDSGSSRPSSSGRIRSPPSLASSPAVALDTLHLTQNESRTLDYFLHRAAPCLAATQDASFWTSLVPRAIRQDTAALNAVLAISCMFEHPPETSDVLRATSAITTTQSQALKWQSQSIKGFHTSLSQFQPHDKSQTEIALLSCVLLTTIEYQQNNVHNALALLKHGYDMASTIPVSTTSNNISSTIKGILVPILARQTVLMASFGTLPPKKWFARFQSTAPTFISTITSLTDARAGLYTCLFKAMEFAHIARAAYMLDTPPDMSPLGPLKSQQAAVMAELAQWDKAFFLFNQNRTGKSSLSQQEQLAATTMIMYYNVAYIWTSTEFDATHTAQDSLLHRFERIIQCAETLLDAAKANRSSAPTPTPFSFEMGIIPPLFFTGTQCRHPLIRRKTIELLRRAPKQEALFAAELNARAIEKVIELEEHDSLRYSVANGSWDGTLPSQEMRCDNAAIVYEMGGGKKLRPKLSFVRGYMRDESGKPATERGAVPLY
ncbi:hypothetical protein PMZ80_001702 [Knufia obscura]|uniref:Uncharacterized protein n=1 Tax=Knufia obscura TaxID=1635080 RepID=A0ABR0S3W6_9EURO|nr:hypothetical protein PMZ80_001702 [Knufia obscura]